MRIRPMTGQRFGAQPDPQLHALQYGRKPRPVCPVHDVEMKKGSSPPGIRYSYCPVPGCDCSAKESR